MNIDTLCFYLLRAGYPTLTPRKKGGVGGAVGFLQGSRSVDDVYSPYVLIKGLKTIAFIDFQPFPIYHLTLKVHSQQQVKTQHIDACN